MAKKVKKIVKIGLLIILFVLIFLSVSFIYKINILIKQVKAYNEFISYNNCKYTYESKYEDDDMYTTGKSIRYQMDGKAKILSEHRNNYGGTSAGCEYIVGNEIIAVNETDKIFSITENYYSGYELDGIGPKMLYINQFLEENIFAKFNWIVNGFTYVVPDKIITEEYNGKDCYKCIFNQKYGNTESYVLNSEIIYMDKETFLPIYEIEEQKFYEGHNKEPYKVCKEIKKFTFEKNVVTDQDVVVPDLSNYGQQINNFQGY